MYCAGKVPQWSRVVSKRRKPGAIAGLSFFTKVFDPAFYFFNYTSSGPELRIFPAGVQGNRIKKMDKE
jgi:hypothetical protein